MEWDVFLPHTADWQPMDGVCPIRVKVACLAARLSADHVYVPLIARWRGCKALVTVGFLPSLSSLPVAAHVVTLHHADRANRTGWLRSQYRGLELRKLLDGARLVITNSDVAARELTRMQSSVQDRLLVSPEGVQHELFHTAAAPGEVEAIADRYSLHPGYVLWVSNFYPYKQVDLFLKAYAGLSKAEREQHPVALVGGDWQGSRGRAERLAESLGIAQNVHFLGWVPDEWLAPLYRHAAFHTLASRAETFGRTVVEAMACGTLCVVNEIAIMREVTAGHAIFTDFAATGSATASLRQAFGQTNSNSELRKKGIERARQFSMRRLALERVTAIVERFG